MWRYSSNAKQKIVASTGSKMTSLDRRTFLRGLVYGLLGALAPGWPEAEAIAATEAAPSEEENDPCGWGASGICLTPDSVFCEDCNTEWVQPVPEPEIEFFGDTITMVGRKPDGTWDSIVIGKGVRG